MKITDKIQVGIKKLPKAQKHFGFDYWDYIIWPEENYYDPFSGTCYVFDLIFIYFYIAIDDDELLEDKL